MKFRKHRPRHLRYVLIAVYIIFLSGLFFIAGCYPVEQKPTKTVEVQVQEAGPVETEPAKVQQPKTEPPLVSLPTHEPPIAEPNQIEPNIIEPNVVEPNIVEIQEVEPNAIEPNEIKRAVEVSFHDKCADIFENFVDKESFLNE